MQCSSLRRDIFWLENVTVAIGQLLIETNFIQVSLNLYRVHNSLSSLLVLRLAAARWWQTDLDRAFVNLESLPVPPSPQIIGFLIISQFHDLRQLKLDSLKEKICQNIFTAKDRIHIFWPSPFPHHMKNSFHVHETGAGGIFLLVFAIFSCPGCSWLGRIIVSVII